MHMYNYMILHVVYKMYLPLKNLSPIWLIDIPSGYLTVRHEKSPFLSSVDHLFRSGPSFHNHGEPCECHNQAGSTFQRSTIAANSVDRLDPKDLQNPQWPRNRLATDQTTGERFLRTGPTWRGKELLTRWTPLGSPWGQGVAWNLVTSSVKTIMILEQTWHQHDNIHVAVHGSHSSQMSTSDIPRVAGVNSPMPIGFSSV